MSPVIIDSVRLRAGDRCEYCRVRTSDRGYPGQIDHVIARQHGGEDDLANLALACGRCNRHKGPNLGGRDPSTGESVWLFNPRSSRWNDHFRLEAGRIIGLTAIGRATVITLNLNVPAEISLRAFLQRIGRMP